MFEGKKTVTGIEITETDVRAVRIRREKPGWRLLEYRQVPFRHGTLNPAYRANNIIDSGAFRDTMQKAIDGFGSLAQRVGVAIPNQTVKITLQKFSELPNSEAERERLVQWSISRSLPSSGENTRVAHCPVGTNPRGETRMLLAIGIEDVLQDYQNHLKSVGIAKPAIGPAGLHLFNFYRPLLKDDDTNAFFGLFEDYFICLVLDQGGVTFHHGNRRGFSDLNFFQDVDVTLQNYITQRPEREIHHLLVGSHVGFHRELKDVFSNLSDRKVTLLDERRCIVSDMDPKDPQSRKQLAALGPAIGAAMWG